MPNGGVRLIGNEKFPRLVDDSLSTLRKLRALNPDIYLSGHPQERFKDTIEAMKAGKRPHPLQQPGEWARSVANMEAQFLKRVADEKAKAGR